jgi:transcription-repair coupling factor (superfamily II helicase)
VGFELYCELLKEAVDILKGEAPQASAEAVVELPVDAYIPEDYISEEETRVEEYRRLIVAARAGTLDEFAGELEDRFGEAPTPVKQLLDVERLRLKAAHAGLESATTRGTELQLKFLRAEETPMLMVADFAESEGMVGKDGTYTDLESRTIYLKLRFAEVNNRQEVLLMWLNSIIDDIIFVGRSVS